MYSREYDGLELQFEASGGLWNSSLVMQDKQTDTYWSIMAGNAIGGELAGTELRELPVSAKIRWDDWRERHPDTLVLSVDGREHAPDAYQRYWEDPNGFRGQQADDDRLPTKEPIFAFEYGGVAYAVPIASLARGAAFSVPNGPHVLLWRRPDSEMFEGTVAHMSWEGFERRDDSWIETGTGAALDQLTGRFVGADVEPLLGFDTFWYNWSLTHRQTVILE